MTTRKRPTRAVPAKTPAPPKPAEVQRRFGVAEASTMLSSMLGQELEQLTAGGRRLTATQRQTQIRRCVSTLAELAELTGEASAMPEAKVVRLPAFRRVIAEVVAALDKWPDALAHVGESLARLERGEAAGGKGP